MSRLHHLTVFLIPLGPSSHVAYCEPADSEPDVAGEEERGLFGGLVRRFRRVLSEAEQSRLEHDETSTVDTWTGRMKARTLGWLADRIAEQRLLWQLRGRHEATLVFPTDVPADEAMRTLRDDLERDGDRHRRWLLIDGLLLLLSALLALVPGPNLIAYYFAFRVVGHYLSMRGVRQGLHVVAWRTEPSDALQDLRAALHLDPHTRHSRVRDIARRLDLQHLASFVERIAFKSA